MGDSLREKQINEIINSLDNVIPLEISKNLISEYSMGSDYEYEYNQVMQVLKCQAPSSSFYDDDFLSKLIKCHIEKGNTISLEHLDSSDFFKNLKRLVAKWIAFKVEMIDDQRRSKIFEKVEEFEKDLNRLLNEKGKGQIENVKLNDRALFEHLIFMECVAEWQFLSPILRSIYQDFYIKGHDLNYINEKYFKNKDNSMTTLLFFIVATGADQELSSSLVNPQAGNVKASRLLSIDEIEKISSSLFREVNDVNVISDRDLKMIIDGGHRISLNDPKNLNHMGEMYQRLGLFKKEILFNTLGINKKSLTIDDMVKCILDDAEKDPKQDKMATLAKLCEYFSQN